MGQPKVKAGGHHRAALDNTWQTPARELDAVREYFGGPIPFDPATCPSNPTKALQFCAGPPGTIFAESMGDNGLAIDWPDVGVFVNPPYGRELKDWLTKMAVESARGVEIVALLPASRWEMPYLHRALAQASVVCFPRGRIHFISSTDGVACKGTPGPSMFLGFNVEAETFYTAFGTLGACFLLEATA